MNTIYGLLTNSFGCIDSTMQTATVLCQPIANFDSTYVCFGDNKVLTNQSSPILGMDWKWKLIHLLDLILILQILV